MFFSILIFVAFIVFVGVLQKSQRKSLATYSAAAQANDPFKDLAQELGLHYEVFSPETNKNTLYSSGSLMKGNYQNIPVEVTYAMTTESAPANFRYAASYTMQKTIAFRVKNSQKKEFQILPKSFGGQGGTASGNSRFDETLSLIGESALPLEIIEYCAELGWMNLSLKGDTLLFSDTFYDERAGVQMMNLVHPIWKSTPLQTAIDMQSAKRFFDIMTKFAATL